MGKSAIDLLTEQELACLQGVADLKRSKQIGYELDLKSGTVDTYIARAVRKLGATDRHSAVRMLVDAGVLSRKSGSSNSNVEPISQTAKVRAWDWLPWPFPTKRRPTNDFGWLGTIIAVLFAAMAMMTVTALYFLGISMLSHRH